MPVPLWLVGYRDGKFRASVAGKRIKHTLPSRTWLNDRLASIGEARPVDGDACDSAKQSRDFAQVGEVYIQGLLVVDCTPTSTCADGVLTNWTLEAEALLQYVLQPADAYTLQIQQVWTCSGQVALSLCRPTFEDRRRPDPVKFLRSRPLCTGVWGDDVPPKVIRLGAQEEECASEVMRAFGVRAGEQSYTDWHILLYPEQVIKLMLAGLWQDVLLLTRWHPGFQIHPEFPRRDARVMTADAHTNLLAPSAPVEFSVDRYASMARNLRKWSPAILDVHPADRSDLESTVGALANLASDRCHRPKLTRSGSDHLIACIKSSWFMRGGFHNMNALLDELLPGLLPPGTIPAGQRPTEWLEKLPAEATIRYNEFRFDAALMVWRQRHTANLGRAIRWFVSDSSVQADYDWIWTSFTEVAESDMITLVLAVCKLELDMKMFEEAMENVERHVPEQDGDSTRSDDGVEEDNQPSEDMIRRFVDFTRQPSKFCLEEWRPHLDTIAQSFHHHVCPPAALESTSLADKCAALRHMFYPELPASVSDRSFLSSGASHLSDMGTELGIADFEAVTNLMAPWYDRSDGGLDIDMGDDVAGHGIDNGNGEHLPLDTEMTIGTSDLDTQCFGESGGAEFDCIAADIDGQLNFTTQGDAISADVDGQIAAMEWPQEASSEPTDTSLADPPGNYFLPWGLTIPGMQHILHNAACDVHQVIVGWPSFWTRLKSLERLLNSAENRRRLLHTCFKGSVLEDEANKKFKYWSASLYEARWGEILHFCRRLVDVLQLLPAGWSETAWLRGGGSEAAELNAQEITAALADVDFPAYLELTLAIEEVTLLLQNWSRRCPCHDYLLRRTQNRKAARKLMSLHYKGLWQECPLSGCWAPELAAGKISKVMASVWDSCESKMLKSLRVVAMSESSRSQLLADFRSARVHISTIIHTKMRHWQALPWLLCGLGHHDDSVAQDIACKELDKFSAHPEEAAHHRVTWALMKPGSAFRADLEAVASGASRWAPERHSRFAIDIGRFKFISVDDTAAERPHALVSRRPAGKNLHMSPVKVSLCNRMPLLLSHIKRYGDEFLDVFSECFERLEETAAIATSLNIDRHPEVQAALGLQHRSGWTMRNVLSSVVYRTCVDDMFASKAVPAKENELKKLADRRRDARLVQKATLQLININK